MAEVVYCLFLSMKKEMQLFHSVSNLYKKLFNIEISPP